jgi:hypothetical protein
MPIKIEIVAYDVGDNPSLLVGKVVAYSSQPIDSSCLPQLPKNINLRGGSDFVRVSFTDDGPKELIFRDVTSREEKSQVRARSISEIIVRGDESVEFDFVSQQGMARVSWISQDDYNREIYLK